MVENYTINPDGSIDVDGDVNVIDRCSLCSRWWATVDILATIDCNFFCYV